MRRADDERIAALTRQGLTASIIAAKLGISIRTVQRARVRTGIARPAPRRFTEDEIRLAEALFDDGCSYKEVARTLGRHQHSVYSRFLGRSVWPWGSGIECRGFQVALDAIKPPVRTA